ncbi:MAG TPA: hypothetical protein VGV89_09265 [Thermoplasmata archaeon]|nr:hypothetical protein [Thermoplasmata archaeon]
MAGHESESLGDLAQNAPRPKSVTGELRERLRAHFDSANWFLLEEMPAPPAEGAEKKWRAVDAYAIALWSTRGHEIHGVEIKASRSDWLAELADPQKAEAGAQFCGKWWLLAAKGVVREAELPPGWGLLTPSRKGLREQVKPVPREPMEPPRWWWICAMKKLVARPTDPELLKMREDSYADGLKRGEDAGRWQRESAQRDLQQFRKSVDAFEKASGIKISAWDGGELGRAVGVVLAQREFVHQTAHAFRNIEREAKDLRDALDAAGWRVADDE